MSKYPFLLLAVLVVAFAVKVPPMAGALLWCAVVALILVHHEVTRP